MSNPAFQPRRNSNLHGKTVVITGASSGAGRAAAIEFARHGANLILASRRPEALEAVLLECEELGGRAVSAKIDVTDAAAVKGLAAAACSYTGEIDIWINNAGVLAMGPFDETPVEVHDQVINTNLLGYIHGAHAVLPYFKSQGYGVLINNISVGGWFPAPYAVGYTASKFGLRGFSQALKGELGSWPGIRICDIYTAFLDTPGVQHAANYTGVALKPAPPVIDPQKVARKMVSLAQNPSQGDYTDIPASLLKFAAGTLPVLTRMITRKVMEAYFKTGKPIENTNGNVFQPVEYGSSIHGGWSTGTPKERVIKRSILGTGIVLGLFLISKVANSGGSKRS